MGIGKGTSMVVAIIGGHFVGQELGLWTSRHPANTHSEGPQAALANAAATYYCLQLSKMVMTT